MVKLVSQLVSDGFSCKTSHHVGMPIRFNYVSVGFRLPVYVCHRGGVKGSSAPYSQGPVKQVRGPGHNVSCGAPALVLHENMRNTCLNYLQVRPR